MIRRSGNFLLGVLLCAAAQAATTTVTLTVVATGSTTSTGIVFAGSANIPPLASGGQFGATLPLSSISSATAVVPYTLTFGANTITGNLTIPVAVILAGNQGSASATVTGGTGAYAGATGSFPTLTGTGGLTSTGSITLNFSGSGTITTGGSSGGGGGTTTPTPVITAVLDAGGYTSNIAQGSIFVVKGSNLSASGYNAASFPLLTTYNNVSITFTPAAGGSGTQAYLVYTYNVSGVNQLAAVLPSTLAVGSYNVTVTSSGTTSAPFVVQVVKSKPGLISQDSTGSGLVVAQNYISASQLDIDRFTTGSVSGSTISPAHPGQTLIVWGTGMGPVAGGDNIASAGYNFAANGVNVQVLVGGVAITPFYAGRAPGLAGADQIDFTLPSNVPTGCVVSFQISVNGVLSNGTFLAIAPDTTSGACVQPGFTTSQLTSLDQGGTISAGGFDLFNITETLPTLGTQNLGLATGGFYTYTGFQLAGAAAAININTSGACTVVTSTNSTPVVTSSGGTSLDAGTVTLTGPSGSGLTNTALTETLNTYSLTIGSSLIPGGVSGSLVAGTYSLNGAGGKDVGKFSTSVTIGTPLTITGGLPASVNRSAGFTLNWTGGNATDVVEIIGYSSATSASSSVEFVCTTTAAPKTFTVPSSITSQLPASTAGFLEVASFGSASSFTAPLTAGGTIQGTFSGLAGTGSTVSYQ